MRTFRIALCLTISLAFTHTAPATALPATRVASNLRRPLFVTAPSTDTQRLFIIEQHSGRIRVLDLVSMTLKNTPFLTIDDLSTGAEQGLLGLAFDPGFGSNGYFYVDYTDSGGTTRVVRYQVSADPDVADPTSAVQILKIDQPQSNHNGGWIGFGPDGYLYIASGDGGAGNDQGAGHTEPGGNAQDITDNWLGKLLRIDVGSDAFLDDPTRNYAIPSTNPFVGIEGDDEIWAYGLRNPWRCSFDRLTGDLYIGDVGQSAREEVNVQPANSTGGENYGWRWREGTLATSGVGGPAPSGAIGPIYEYAHNTGPSGGFSITGGYVYRGPAGSLNGHYFFADYVTQRIWSVRWDGSAPSSFDGSNYSDFTDWSSMIVPNIGSINQIASFGEDAQGNLYIVDLGGEIFRLDAPPELGPTEPFFSYKIKGTRSEPSFVPFGPITLSDALRNAEYNVHAPLQLALVADTNGAGVIDPNTHLVEYKLATAVGTPKLPGLSNITVLNRCNTLRVKIAKPLSLLVPTAMSPTSPVSAPDPMMHSVDHFLCYRAKTETKLPKRIQASVGDALQTRRYDLKKVTKLCLPVAKSGNPVFLSGSNTGQPKPISAATIHNPTDHLLCYKATLARREVPQNGCIPLSPSTPGTLIEPPQPRHTPRLGLYVSNQFGSSRYDSQKELELCIPSAMLLPPP